ncbi:hypothetical protein GDO78_012240 [Eleutherodactylus coqui]|uniref:Amyloid-beta A4 precursor protein-binding family A member 3 n=1 Tax=Eleutherodactylus coqui TaxID=57060 RepID=A0A8J6K5K3_ELECQ|nr:hypothetical protein GDO78_012240 [Eleutherodactylus coqui]
METAMELLRRPVPPPSRLSGDPPGGPQVELENAGRAPPAVDMDTRPPPHSSGGRAPPRVDSCADMDTRPPGSEESTVRAPPGVDSCADMDIRPPSRGSEEATVIAPPAVDMDTRPPPEVEGPQPGAPDTFHMQELLLQLPACPSGEESCSAPHVCQPCLLHIAMGKGLADMRRRSSEPAGSHGLLLTDSARDGMLTLFQCEAGTLSPGDPRMPLARLEAISSSEEGAAGLEEEGSSSSSSALSREESLCSLADQDPQEEISPLSPNFPAPPKVPGPCEPEDLLDGVVFGAKYLGSTQLQCERHQMASARVRQAQEAVDRVKAPDGESQPMTEVDVMVSTQRVKVLTADTQEALMDHPLQTISYTADIGNVVVIMARRKSPRSPDQPSSQKRPHKMLCHVFQSADAQLIAQAIGQAFGLAYLNFLHSQGLEPERQDNTRVTEQLYNANLAHFTKKDNIREVYIQKEKGEMLGAAVVESGWGSLLPTVVIANLMHGGPAERSGELSIGDYVTSVNGTSLVGLPFSTCQGLIRDLKSQSEVIICIVRCPPVVTAIIQRPDTTYQLGFSVEDGVICSLIRGGIAERGGIRVGHRIIEINGQSVVATAHEKIIQTLLDATGEVHIKTMPASTYRLLTGQETPVYL